MEATESQPASQPNVSDEDWVALGAIEDDAAYLSRFKELFDIDLTVPALP